MMNIIYIILVINTLGSFSAQIPLIEYNETNLIRSESSQLRVELENQKKWAHEMELEIKFLKEEFYKKESSRFNIPNCNMVNTSGSFHIIVPNFSSEPFTVSCDAETQGGGWTVILRRMDGSVNFTRNWAEYQKGFGDLGGEFFLGLDKIHALTSERNQKLLVVLEDFEGNEVFESYIEFGIGNEFDEYALHKLGEASGTAGNSLARHYRMKFSTYDRDNDLGSAMDCAKRGTGAWWYDYCQESQLTGSYKNNVYNKGINWNSFRGPVYSLKKAVMMIRPKI